MPFRDILLTALTYPDATPDRALRSGVALARRFGGDLTLLVPRIDIPQVGNPLARALMDFDRIASLETARSAATASLEATCAAIAAEESGVALRTETLSVALYDEAEAICRVARTRDLALTPIGPEVAADRSLAEALLFGSGRPILVYPEAAEVAPADGFRHVAVAWDGSARAARATADALPALARADRVSIFAALGEKTEVVAGGAAPLGRHLARHGIRAVGDGLGGEGRTVGRLRGVFVVAAAPDPPGLVGIGLARLRQSVPGGAPPAVPGVPPRPVSMPH